MSRTPFVLAAALSVALVACSGDDAAAPTEPAATSPDVDEPSGLTVVAGEPFPAERCAANEAAGTIVYLTGFDYAAAASILEVLVADQAGYYDELCLDVEIRPSFSTANYALVAGGEAQFASSGSFSELVTQARANDADLVTLSVGGHIAVDVLMVKPDRAASLADLAGQTIGVKGALPPSIAVMLQQEAGLAEGQDYRTALLDGFDPFAHWAIDDIAALPGWRSNEPGALERGGETFDLYDPAEFGVPGSFGLIYTDGAFLAEHPTAVEDFMRATMRGLADAIADPGHRGDDCVRARRGQRQPELPVGRGRDVPLDHRRRCDRRVDPGGQPGRGAGRRGPRRPDRRLRLGRLLRRRGRPADRRPVRSRSRRRPLRRDGEVVWPG
jgi:ABC-type nitrate/sulfonate/bicarbonate transport system substrate-binding protein